MFRLIRDTRLRHTVIALYALAMALVGVMPTMAAPVRTGDLSAFALPGQDAPILCLTGDPDDPGAPDTHHLCSSCVLIGAAGTGALPVLELVTERIARSIIYAHATQRLALTSDIWPVSRGPPTTRA